LRATKGQLNSSRQFGDYLDAVSPKGVG